MSFDREMEASKKQLLRGIEKVVGQAAFAILGTVVRATPVGNPTIWKRPNSAPPGYTGGRAKGNWQVGLGSSNDRETGAIDKSGTGTIDKGNAQIKKLKLGQDIIIFNNVPYIVRLNMGHSRQARPAGFIERAVQAGIESLNGQDILL